LFGFTRAVGTQLSAASFGIMTELDRARAEATAGAEKLNAES
jgi:hypothetical protein